ncbi:hypothetical protein U9M48_021438 [Paspalum notatum var. saurae]|uniref:Nonsense-mediated mRNA decay factor SMG8 n=1 Tax=Paspalum notatum var. saurae TaxID=547442 RepID=A0AAQ3WTR8_PASNO
MEPPPPPPATPSAAVRVLSRTPPPASTNPSSASSTGTPSPASHDGVVAVGFVGGAGSARLADRILDAHVFSPGGSAGSLAGSVRYHQDGDKRMVFLHLAPPPSPLEAGGRSADLAEMLFMFSVCHVIIFLQEGFRFNTQTLKKLRLLQSSKNAFAPFVKSLVAAAMPAKTVTTDTPTRASHRASSISPPARRGGHTGRQSSAISLMSGTSSNSSVLPGQCVPALLFVFEDDTVDVSSAAASSDDMGDASSSNLGSISDGLSKQSLASKGSGSVVMLARAAHKSEGNSGKKLHSSLEGQIRVLLKKCRVLAGTEPGHIGPRGVSNMNHHAPLFSLDTSRVVALLERSINKKQEPLDIIAELFEDSLICKSPFDILSLENDHHPTNHVDFQLIKDFIFRQSDALRGRGGYSSNSTTGSVAGVGMVAAAAAAAAASASAGKTVNAPDLPSFDKWLSISTSILTALLSGRNALSSQSQSKTHTSPNEKNDQLPPAASNAIEIVLSCLESNNGLNMKFSSAWCQRVLPAAKEIYLKGLPPFYPTSMHEVQLQKALRSFGSMVKGPAVRVFSKKLEDECRTIWESGRQQCDAVSLTGRPCKHPRHGDFSSLNAQEQHSSGYVFLHACACGRSRRLRDDPFDFQTANVSFNCFANCEDLLPTLVLPRGSDTGSFSVSSWRLVRLGGARYYKPTKGLLQSGFCSKERYLLRWMISVGKGQMRNVIRSNTTTSSTRSTMSPQTPPVVTGEVKSVTTQVTPQIKLTKLENSRKNPEVESMSNSSINFGKGLPNFTMKKPFAEVVAGTTAKDSEFPALQQTRPPKPGGRKDERQMNTVEQTNGQAHTALSQGPVPESESAKASGNKSSENADGKPFLQIGSNIVPVIVGNETRETYQPLQQFAVYVGFEHECPCGHRFLLSEKHMKEIDPSCLPYQRSYLNKEAESKHALKLPRNASALTASTVDINVGRKNSKPLESPGRNRQLQSLQPRVDPDTSQPSALLSDPQNDKTGEHYSRCITIDDGGEAFSLMNRNLPIYMHCPHCKSSERKEHQDVKFAGVVSQLQRIFIVLFMQVTPDFPVLLASCPLGSCLPSNVSDHEREGLFSVGCRVILPPESFLTMRLPFVYGVETKEGSMFPLRHFEQQPELTAWLVGGTALQIVSVGDITEKETILK